MFAACELVEHLARPLDDAMHGIFRHDERHPNTAAQFLIQPVEQRAATGQLAAAVADVGRNFWRQFFERALDEFGQFVDWHRQGLRDVVRP